MNDTNWQNLPNTTTPILAEKLNKLDRVVIVTTANTDLNNYKTDGEFYFSADYIPTNIPAGVNRLAKSDAK